MFRWKVTLAVEDKCGQPDSYACFVEIPPQDDAPLADFCWKQKCCTLKVDFEDQSNDPSGCFQWNIGGIESWLWDFGHGEVMKCTTPEDQCHEYPEGGECDVKLTVTDKGGRCHTQKKHNCRQA